MGILSSAFVTHLTLSRKRCRLTYLRLALNSKTATLTPNIFDIKD